MDRLRKIVKQAIDASTMADADELQSLIQGEIGKEYRRPLFDTVDNYGAISGGSGLWDHKALEPVTNMQDAVLEREALRRFTILDNVPYTAPLQAARDLFSKVDLPDLASRALVNIRESDAPVRQTKLITIVYRDAGIGLTAAAIPNTIFGLASSKKNVSWQQGAFGIGGKTTYRNARRVIVISRRAPEALAGGEDRIAIAVLQWHFSGKTQTASYLVTAPWTSRGDDPPVFSVPATAFADFQPGTQLSLISYGVEHIWVGTRLGDDRSFDTLLNTRLFDPVLPTRFHHFEQRESPANLRGLRKRLDDNPGKPARPHGKETLPFSAGGTTYHLPISFWAFAGPSEASDQRRRFVSREHVVCFTSNGQVHHHLSQADFQHKIPTLKKLADRIFIVIEADELPIELRSTLFTSDRSAFMRTADALRLEEQVNAFIREWQTLRDLNGELIRESLSKAQDGRSTLSLARELGRAFKGIGFGGALTNKGTPTAASSIERQQIELLNDPTYIDGPASVRAEVGGVKFIQYVIDAKDGFIPERAQLSVSVGPECGLSSKEITVGQLSKGRIRVAVSIPEYAPEAQCTLSLSVSNWLLAAGGVGPELRFETVVQTHSATDMPARPQPTVGKSTQESAAGGDLIPVIWTGCDAETSWTPATIGAVELMSGEAIATARPEYAELSSLGGREIHALMLNRDFSSFKKYISATARETTDKTTDKRRDRYAVAVGTGLMNFEIEHKKLSKAGKPISNDVVSLAHRSIAAAVLADMRAYDQLANEAGVANA